MQPENAESRTIQTSVFRRPTPEMPKVVDAADVGDIFSYSLLNQTQCTLFRFADVRTPVPWLVKDFDVSRDQKVFFFTLTPTFFQDGSPITASDVKKSLEASISKGAVNSEAFSKILGFTAFTTKKAKEILGIHVTSEQKIEIRLSKPDPQLPSKLTDIRFSIRKVKNPTIGCGTYKIDTISTNKIELSRFYSAINPAFPSAPKRLTYEKVSKQNAIEGFKSGLYDDLSNYVLEPDEEVAASKYANISEVNFPRTYFFAVNSKTITDRKIRAGILSLLDRKKIIKTCYDEQKLTNSLVPPGFLGFNENSLIPPTVGKSILPKGRTIKIRVISSIGAENCVVNILRSQMSARLNVDIRTAPIEEFVAGWDNGKLDAIFAYMEGETTFHYFGSFNPKSKLSYGDRNFAKFDERFYKIDAEPDPIIKQTLSQELATEIISKQTLLPFFHFRGKLLVSKRFTVNSQIFTSPALTPLSSFAMVTK